jgi:hypothetical protein
VVRLVPHPVPKPSPPLRPPSPPAVVTGSDKAALFLLFLAATSLAEFPPPSPIQMAAPVGSKLSLFTDRWKDSSPYLGSVAEEGVWVQWLEGVPPPFRCGKSRFLTDQMILFDDEVSSLLGKQAISQVSWDQAYFICSLFLVDKKGGGSRPCLNLKPLNVFTRPKHFKM